MTEESCANCGKAEELEACNKRAAELHEEALFKQPPKGDDCPICFLLLPRESGRGKTFMPCCGKTICCGCDHAHQLQSSGRPTCPFCRAKTPFAKECIKMLKKRVDANDADAILQLGRYYIYGKEDSKINKDIGKAVKLLHCAAELGSAEAYHDLGAIYYRGDDVSKDRAKAKQYFEKGAMRGCASSRFNLGIMHAQDGRPDQAIKHWLIGASGGEIQAIDGIKRAIPVGIATRDDYAQALRGYQLYLNEIRSDERDRAAAYSEKYKYLPDM
jgi:hypothetical protein